MTYDPKFSVKQMYDQYGRSRNTTKTAGPKGFTKKNTSKPSKSVSLGGFEPDPAQRSSRGLGSKPTFNFGTDDSGADNNPNRDEYESKGVIAKLYDRAVATFRNFGADEPEDVIVDGQRVYQGPLFRGYTPDTSNLFVDNNPNRDRRAVMPDSTMNMFGVNTDNPSLNMFGVLRNSFRNPDPFIPPVLPESPANVDDVTRALSQGMRPEPTVIDGEPVSTIEVKAGQTLFDIRDQYNESTLSDDKKITVEDIRRFNDIPLDGMFGIKPGTELKLPIRKETEVDRLRRKVEEERSINKALIEFERLPEAQKEKIRDSYRLLEQAQPASFKEKVENFTGLDLDFGKFLSQYTKKLEEERKFLEGETGIDIITNESVIQDVVNNAIKITTDDTKENITAYQNKLNSLGFYSGRADGAYGKRTKNGIKMYQKRNGLTVTGTMNEETVNRLNSGNSIVPTSKKVGNLTVSTAYRDEIDPSQLVIATDFNSTKDDNTFASGVEVIVPQSIYDAGPGNPYFDAAQNYVNLVIEFAKKKGYTNYSARKYGKGGVKPNVDRGRPNTIHTEPFFRQDTKMVDIVNANKKEFFDLYVQAFGNLDTTLVAPHGRIKKTTQDQGTFSSVLGSEKNLGDEGIKYIMDNY